MAFFVFSKVWSSELLMRVSLLSVSNLPVFSMWAGLCLWNSALCLVNCNID
jgi:hypothetical protein